MSVVRNAYSARIFTVYMRGISMQPKLMVYLLWHMHELPNGEEDNKLIGVYSSPESAERARQRKVAFPGFRDLPDSFIVDVYEVDQDAWSEGYVTMIGDAEYQPEVGDASLDGG